MKPLLLLALVAALGLSACGAAEDTEPVAATGEPEPAALPDVARVICEPAGTRVETPTIKPQADGIHFEIVNEAGSERAFSVQGKDSGMGQGAPVGTSTMVSDLAPGTVEVACADPAADVQQGSPIDVVDEDGVYVAATLDCEVVSDGILDYVPGAKGEPSPIEAVRKQAASQLEPDDVVAPVGYPEAVSPAIGLTRDDSTIAVFHVVSDGSGGWLVEQTTACPPYGSG